MGRGIWASHCVFSPFLWSLDRLHSKVCAMWPYHRGHCQRHIWFHFDGWIGMGIVLACQQLQLMWIVISSFIIRIWDVRVMIAINVKISFLLKRSRSSISYDKWGPYFEHVVQSYHDCVLLVFVLNNKPRHVPFLYCSNIRWMYLN